jgi:hypothetical protein
VDEIPGNVFQLKAFLGRNPKLTEHAAVGKGLAQTEDGQMGLTAKGDQNRFGKALGKTGPSQDDVDRVFNVLDRPLASILQHLGSLPKFPGNFQHLAGEGAEKPFLDQAAVATADQFPTTDFYGQAVKALKPKKVEGNT